jgi:hypothetical protein
VPEELTLTQYCELTKDLPYVQPLAECCGSVLVDPLHVEPLGGPKKRSSPSSSRWIRASVLGPLFVDLRFYSSSLRGWDLSRFFSWNLLITPPNFLE